MLMSLARSRNCESALKNIMTWHAGVHVAFQAIMVSALEVLMMTSRLLLSARWEGGEVALSHVRL